MYSRPENRLLKLLPGAVEDIRKIHNLDKPERLEEAIKILEEWIKKQEHFIKIDYSKEYLEKILISCKGSVEKSKKQIDRLCTMKSLLSKFFSKTNVKAELQSILDLFCLTPLPTPTEDYGRVIIIKIKKQNFTPERFMQYYQYSIVQTQYLKTYDYVDGYIIIFDLSELNLFDLIPKINTAELHQVVTILVDGYGARLKSLHIITDSKAIELLIKIVKQFVSEKIGNRIQVQSTIEDLHKVVPKDILPIEYGGNERSIEKLHAEWVEELSSEKHVEYMKMMNKACSDETKRHEGKFNEEYMGMPGSFRCLSVD